MNTCILYMSINLVMPSRLKSEVFGALYPALHIFLIDFFCNISSLCSLYWYAHLHNIVSTIRMIRMNKTSIIKLSIDKYILTVSITHDSLDTFLTIWLMWSSHSSPLCVYIPRNFTFLTLNICWFHSLMDDMFLLVFNGANTIKVVFWTFNDNLLI